MIKNILLSLIPIFVAVDAVGTLPIFIAFTRGVESREKSRIIVQSVATAAALSVGFVFVGRAVFALLGVSIGDFLIAGGSILFCIAILDIINPEKKRRLPGSSLGVVPLGTPLIAGPALLTTSLICITEYGLLPTLISLLVNILLAGAIFHLSDGIFYLLGETGTKALSKITGLLLATIAVMMIRKGIMEFLGTL